MDLKPSICGTNALNIPSGCEDIGHFIGANNVTIMQGDPFDPTEGVTAVDKDGNTIPYTFSPASINTCTVGTNVVTYSTDSFSTERRVFVLQASAPAISYPHGSLTCNSAACEATLDPNVAPVGEPFDTMEGVSATDSHGMSVAVACLEGNPVTFPAVGTYTLHYTATDACGNVGTAERTVEARFGHFEGVTNASVNQGVGFDLTNGVTALSYKGESVPYTVTPNTFAECQLGDQVFTYTANGVETATRTITVLPIADPTISGTSQPITVDAGEEFDPMSGVSAVDAHGNTVTVTVALRP